MSNLTTIAVVNGIPVSGSGNVSTIDQLLAVGAPVTSFPTGSNTGGVFLANTTGGAINGTNPLPVSLAVEPTINIGEVGILAGNNKIGIVQTVSSTGAAIDFYSAPGSNTVQAVSSDGVKPTYRYAGLAYTPVATPTDFLMIKGSASATIRIKKIKLTGVATAAGNMPVQLIRRSTAFTTQGTAAFTAITAGKHDTNDGAATANVSTIGTANFTSVGANVGGPLGTDRLLFNATATGGADLIVSWDFARSQDKALILRGTSDFIFLNLNGAAVPTGGVIDYEIETEEDNS